MSSKTMNHHIYSVAGGYNNEGEDFDSMMIFSTMIDAKKYANYLVKEDGYSYYRIIKTEVRKFNKYDYIVPAQHH